MITKIRKCRTQWGGCINKTVFISMTNYGLCHNTCIKRSRWYSIERFLKSSSNFCISVLRYLFCTLLKTVFLRNLHLIKWKEFKIVGAHNLILWKLLCRARSALVFAQVEFSKIIVGNGAASINSNSIRGTKDFLSIFWTLVNIHIVASHTICSLSEQANEIAQKKIINLLHCWVSCEVLCALHIMEVLETYILLSRALSSSREKKGKSRNHSNFANSHCH